MITEVLFLLALNTPKETNRVIYSNPFNLCVEKNSMTNNFDPRFIFFFFF